LVIRREGVKLPSNPLCGLQDCSPALPGHKTLIYIEEITMNRRYVRAGRFAGLCLALALLFGACENPASGDDENTAADTTAAAAAAARDGADQFYAAHSGALTTPVYILTLADAGAVNAALEAYSGLGAGVKRLLAEEKAHLDLLKVKLVELENAGERNIYFAVSDLLAWLTEQPENTPDTPYTVAYYGDESIKTLYSALETADGKYVDLDLSASGVGGFNAGYEEGRAFITGLVLPDSLTEIQDGTSPDYIFGGFTNLKTLSAAGVTRVGGYTFIACFSLTTIDMPKAVSIGVGAFYNCTGLTTISLPAAVSIGDNAFESCTSLTTISLPEAVSLGNYAFRGCTILRTVTMPGVVTIGSGAFTSCTDLRSLSATTSLPKAASIGSSAFQGCTYLITVNLPEAVTIGASAFSGCTILTTVTLPKAASIGSGAFTNCSDRLVTVSLPEAASIGSSAFSGCTGLTTVTLPKAASIGASAFSGCTSLATVTLGTAPPTIGSTIFSGAATTAKTITIKAPQLTLYTPVTPWSNRLGLNSSNSNYWDNNAATRGNLTVALAVL
jgi:hypothetical protein